MDIVYNLQAAQRHYLFRGAFPHLDTVCCWLTRRCISEKTMFKFHFSFKDLLQTPIVAPTAARCRASGFRVGRVWQEGESVADMEVWACDNPSPNVSPLCKQIPAIGPIQNSGKNHRRAISQSKPLCEMEDWKDMKALACLLTLLFLSAPSSQLCSHSSVWPSSFNLRYFATVSSVERGSSPEIPWMPCLLF